MLEAKVVKKLLEASFQQDNHSMDNLLKAIHSVIPFKMGSLWKVNNRAQSVSILSRINYTPDMNKVWEFVHKIEGSLIGELLKRSEDNFYYDITDVTKEPYWKKHLSKERARKLDLKRLISIPIPCNDATTHGTINDAIVNFYVDELIDFSESLAQIIRDQFSLTISRNRLLQSEQLTRDIIQIYEKKAQKDLASVLYPIIHSILPKYIRYEGCSVFIWDPFYNRLALSQTTGLVGKPRKSTVNYLLGEGITGCIAELKETIVIDDLDNIQDEISCNEYIHKYQEETNNEPKTFFGIPIMSPSRPDEIIGVIRLTNRLNHVGDVIDYFSIDDCELIEHACRLIALYMDYEYSEKVRLAFAMQMAHEMQTPAFSIRGTSDRLIKNWETGVVSDEKKFKYINDIFDQSSLQVALSNSIIHWGKGLVGQRDKSSYDLSKCSLQDDVIYPSKKLVIPIARAQKLYFDNIEISGFFPDLFIDNSAFQQVFFNLFTNAIKYRKDNFFVKIIGHTLDDYTDSYTGDIEDIEDFKQSYLINVEDYGRGINNTEKFKIFLLGYRASGQESYDVRGLGLGLTVVKSILDDFGCLIWVSNNENPTRFSILMPKKLTTIKYAYSPEWLNGL